MKKNRLFLTFLCIYVSIEAAKKPACLSVTIDDTTFFAVEPPGYKSKKTNIFTEASDKWYAEECKNNETLNTLVDTVIENTDIFFANNNSKKSPDEKNKQKVVIFDVDETLVSNYQALRKNHDEQEVAEGKTAKDKEAAQGDENTQEEVIEITPLVRLLTYFQSQDCKIALIATRLATRENYDELHQQLLQLCNNDQTQVDQIYIFMKPQPWEKLGAHPKFTSDFKQYIRTLLARGYNFDIIATVDDDHRNLLGTHVGRFAIWVPSLLKQSKHKDRFYKQLVKASNADDQDKEQTVHSASRGIRRSTRSNKYAIPPKSSIN